MFVSTITTTHFANAATTPTLSVYTGNSGYMIINVAGDANSSVQLTYYPYGVSIPTTIPLGSTDANGNFMTSISANAYNIVNGTSGYVTVNGLASATIVWPSFANAVATSNSLALSQYSATVSAGQSVVIYSSNNTILYSANSSATSTVTASVNNGQVSILGVAPGSASVNICSTQGNCNSVAVTVMTRNSPLALSQAVVNISVGQGLIVYTANSSITKASSNSANAVAYANNGQVTIIGLSFGTASVSVCNAANTCDSIYVNVQNPTLNSLSLSKNVITVGVGQSALVYSLNGAITSADGNSPNASTAVNSGSGGNQLTITGIESGLETVTVCIGPSNCNVVFVTVQPGSTTNNLALNQYSVLVNVGQSTNVSSNTSTIVTAVSNSSAVTASVSYGQVSIKGQNTGTATVTVCDAKNVCDQVYVTVQNPNIVPPVSNIATVVNPVVVPVVTNSNSTVVSPVVPAKASFVFTRLIKIGSVGSDVTELQKLLIAQGYLKGTSATGKFANLTKKALQLFQTKHGLANVGYTGPGTRAALNAEMKKI